MDSKNISDVFCPSCGAPANFDIIHQNYKCSHCDGRVEISEAVKEKQGFRELHQNKIKESVGNYKLCSASCKNCGATVVFEENESMTTCAFCGTAMVRNEYAGDKELPELIIPFRITEDEAKKIAKEWCKTNNNKIEAKHFSEKIDQMKGFYLPYELVRGSVSGKASRKDSETTYDYRGNVAKEFINGSNQLNNLLLDAMEPFDLTDLAEFDFGYVAGQRVKIKDVNDQEIKQRMLAELEANYKTDMQNTFHTNVLDVSVDAENILRMPVLLPVYYIRDGEFMAAINGQTGKVSVRAEEDSYNYFFPWWGKAFLFTVILSFLADRYILCDAYSGDKLNGARFLIIVFFACISSYYFNLKKNPFKVLADRKIFTSKGGPYIRNANNNLVMSNEKLARTTIPPIFFKKIDDRIQPVELDFSSALKRMLAIAIVPAFFADNTGFAS